MSSRFTQSRPILLAAAALALLGIALVAFDRTTRPETIAPDPDRVRQDGLSDAMTFSPPTGPKP